MPPATRPEAPRSAAGSLEESYFSFEPGLWPSESAWKLRCEIKRAQGFDPGETFVFRGIPFGSLGATNEIRCTHQLRRGDRHPRPRRAPRP